uniref:Uncharacterized protein n=1 Tax=Parascaris equorum TaxID=6256 RepID=A0A914RMU8_PAREQ
MIEFDRSKGGLFVVDDLEYSGKLCNEPVTSITTTIDPPLVSNLFALQSAPEGVKVSAGISLLSQFVKDESYIHPYTYLNRLMQEYSSSLNCDFEADFCAQWESDGKWEYGVTPSSELFELPKFIEGHLAIHVESERSFRIKIVAKSSTSAIAIVRRIEAKGHICPLPSLNQLACRLLKCDFNGQLCAYSSVKWIIDGSTERVILRSPRFELTRPIDVEITLLFNNLLLGPKIEVPKILPIRFRLDIDVRQIAFVMFHDKFLQQQFIAEVFDKRSTINSFTKRFRLALSVIQFISLFGYDKAPSAVSCFPTVSNWGTSTSSRYFSAHHISHNECGVSKTWIGSHMKGTRRIYPFATGALLQAKLKYKRKSRFSDGMKNIAATSALKDVKLLVISKKDGAFIRSTYTV